MMINTISLIVIRKRKGECFPLSRRIKLLEIKQVKF
jgi:hypothetical protein